jgi:hypothetical protein
VSLAYEGVVAAIDVETCWTAQCPLSECEGDDAAEVDGMESATEALDTSGLGAGAGALVARVQGCWTFRIAGCESRGSLW